MSGEPLRLSKLMARLGLCSRREADEYIARGLVRVDGVRVDLLGTKVLPHQRIELQAEARREQAARATILLHKPLGYVSGQPEDGYPPAIALVTEENQSPLFPGDPLHARELRHIAPAGRLDIDSTGLLVFTQDGRIARLLTGADSGVEKEYLVRVRGRLAPEGLERLRLGLVLDGRPLRRAEVSWQNADQLRFVLREGRKRQIRRMCTAVGLEVLGLKRVRIGRVVLGRLEPGRWRRLGPDETF
jgi:23S rRNA pseudouridine2604 synthase